MGGAPGSHTGKSIRGAIVYGWVRLVGAGVQRTAHSWAVRGDRLGWKRLGEGPQEEEGFSSHQHTCG